MKQWLEEELTETKKQLKSTQLLTKRLTVSNKQLSRSLRSNSQQYKKKPLSSLQSRQQRATRRKQVLTDIRQSLLFLEDEGLRPVSVELVHSSTECREIVDLTDRTFSKSHSQCAHDVGESEQDECDKLHTILYVKERFNLSNQAYNELCMVSHNLPGSWKLNLADQTLPRRRWNATEFAIQTLRPSQAPT